MAGGYPALRRRVNGLQRRRLVNHMPIEIRPFDTSVLDDAAALLAARHRVHRHASPGLNPAFEDLAHAREEIARLMGSSEAGTAPFGVAGFRDGTCVGFLLGIGRDPRIWRPNVWVESAGHAVTEPEIVRDLYRAAAETWVGEGRAHHYVIVPASSHELIDAWFRLGFGQQQVHALRPAPTVAYEVAMPAGIRVRPATRADLADLARIDRALPEHQGQSPVFSRLAVPDLAEIEADLAADLEDPRYVTFVAEHDGRPIGSATACSLELSSSNSGLIRPARAGFLGFAAVLPDARGLGAGRVLGETVIAWARDAGYPWVATDWRATNLEASRTWPRIGFVPTFLRLHRTIP
jgi:GNAT superfamily N-acetyltransferase